jgi:hypothetical protein
MKRLAFVVALLAASVAPGQTLPGTRGAASRAATASRAPAGPRNVEDALDAAITLEAQAMPWETLTDLLRERTRTNLAVNWTAFAAAGITRETPITLHLKGVTFEQALRTLMEVLPTKGTQANYTVAENTIEITTNSELATLISSKMYDATRAISYSFTTPLKAEEMLRNAMIFDAVIRAELARAGDPPDAKGHSLVIKDNTLAATISERGQGYINRALNMFNQPLKVGQLAMGTQYTAAGKRTADAYKAFMASRGAVSPAVMARDPEKYPQFNIAVLPGTAEELARDKPEIGTAINDGGVLLLGPRGALGARTLLAIYDLRDVTKRLAAKTKINPTPPPADFQAAIHKILQDGIKPEGGTWGGGEDLGKKPAVMIPYNGLLIVFATAETHRTIAGALQDMNK